MRSNRHFVQADHNGITRSLGTNAFERMACANEVFNESNAYDAATGIFTAPATALYWIHSMVHLADAASRDQLGLAIGATGADNAYMVWGDSASTGNRYTLSATHIMQISAGSQAAMFAYSRASPVQRVPHNLSHLDRRPCEHGGHA